MVRKVNSGSFRSEVLQNEGKVVVDFYADWCGPCHHVAPVIESLSKKYDGEVTFVKVDIDRSPDLAQAYGVRSIPTIALFEGGRLAKRTVGAMGPQALERELGLGGGKVGKAKEKAGPWWRRR